MAKALLGHIGGTELRMVAEVRRLQQRVQELEAQVLRLQADNDALSAALHHDELITFDDERVASKQPALAGSSA